MRFTRSKGVLAGALICGLTGVATAEPADVNAQLDQLKAEMAQLKAANSQLQNKVSTLESDKGDTWLNDRRAEEVKALVRDVLSDADGRASLLEGGMVAGHDDKAFFLADSDGKFRLEIGGQIQIRYVASFRDNNSTPSGAGNAKDTAENNDGFTVRRAKVWFTGFIGSPKFDYKIQLQADRASGAFFAEEAWVRYTLADNLQIWGGRFQDLFSREGYMSSKKQQTADRSTVANLFAANDGWVEGAAIQWKPIDTVRIGGTINDGYNTGNNGTMDFFQNTSDLGLSGRADWAAIGELKNDSDVEAWSSIKDLQLFVGGGLHYEHARDRTAFPTIPYSSSFQWTADAILKYHGLGVMASGYGTYINRPASPALTIYAATVQAGYFVIPDKFEPFVRYEYIAPDSASNTNDLHIVTAGFNWFFKKHDAKFTLDAMWALNNINNANTLGALDSSTGLSGVGFLNDTASTQKNQTVIRAQFQLLF